MDLAQLQQYVADKIEERGLADETVAQKFMLLAEEVGELARAARRFQGMKVADDTAQANLHDEAADVLFVLLVICNKVGIDLAAAFEAKEMKNNQRTWRRSE